MEGEGRDYESREGGREGEREKGREGETSKPRFYSGSSLLTFSSSGAGGAARKSGRNSHTPSTMISLPRIFLSGPCKFSEVGRQTEGASLFSSNYL